MNKRDLFLIISLVLFGVLTRTLLHLGNNIEFITAISLATGYFFKTKKLSFIVTFAIMAISDLVIGNSIIFIFTWSAFLFGNLIGILFSKINITESKFLKLLIGSEIAGIFSTIIFFLWTNLGVVLTTSSYQKTLGGVIQSYINGLPFLRPQIYSNLLLVPIVFVVAYILINSHHLKDIRIKFNF